MTEQYIPTLGIWRTVGNTLGYVNRNVGALWRTYRVYFMYLLAIEVLLFAAAMPFAGEEKEVPAALPLLNFIAQLFKFYIISCFTISWHRVIFHGSEDIEPVRMFNIKNNEVAFMGMWILMGLLGFFVTLGGIIGGVILGKWFAIPAVILFIAVFIFSLKIMFFYPSRAVGHQQNIRELLSLSTGYKWRVFSAGLLLGFAVFLFCLIYFGGMGLLIGYIATVLNGGAVMGFVTFALLLLPAAVILYPVSIAIGVNILVNYYMIALEKSQTT